MSDEHLRPRAGRTIVERLELTKPIACYDREISVLEFEEVKFKHLKAMESAGSSDLVQTGALIGALCDLPDQAVERLSLEDYQRASKVVAGFFAASPPAPGSDSPTAGDEA